ncbi:hypothetical protein L1987_80382 [Smallanthus sonchifolius]|uniref:Uncharacterized protein n=1 Tax=Smallanthus sonchifolius TaxID=185202 RepID=A0ACB8YMP8_9ASTR|nr:hypothetical protein L1987_80382 [Smallanthus sonchifolius]
MIAEFENAVLREPSRVPVPGGTIHPLTKHCDSTAPDMDFTDHEGQSTLKETDVEAACASATHPTADVFL